MIFVEGIVAMLHVMIQKKIGIISHLGKIEHQHSKDCKKNRVIYGTVVPRWGNKFLTWTTMGVNGVEVAPTVPDMSGLCETRHTTVA